MFSVYRFAFIAAATLFLGGCSALSSLFPDRERNIAGPDLDAVYFEPKVRPGLALAISVTATGAQGAQSKQYFVDAEGYITMSLIGQVKVEGLSLIELQQKIATAYKEYYLEPHVTATYVYQAGMVCPWGTVTVLGEVGKPGPVDMPSTMDMRLTLALQRAGGVTSIADKRRVKVTRCDKDGNQTRTIVDLVEIGEDGRPDKDMLLRSGDVVWVPMAWY